MAFPVGAAISAGASLLNGIFGGSSQSASNKAYLAGIKATNEANYKIWQEQKEHNKEMFDLENQANRDNWQWQFDLTNEYNSAAAQRQRLEDAGLNPSLMMSGANAGVASSSGIPGAHSSPAPAPQMQAPAQTTPVGLVFSQQTMNGMLQFAQSLNILSQKNERDSMLPLTLSLMGTQDKSSKEQYDIFSKYGEQDAKMRSLILGEEYQRNVQSNYLQGLIRDDVVKEYRANRILAECNAQQAQILNRYVDPQAQVNYAKDIAELALLWSRKDLTDKEAQLKINEMAYTAWKTALAKQEYKFNEDTAELRKAGMVQDNLGKYYEREQKQLNVAMFKRMFGSMFSRAVAENSFFSSSSNVSNYYRYSSGQYNRGVSEFIIGIPKLLQWRVGGYDTY